MPIAKFVDYGGVQQAYTSIIEKSPGFSILKQKGKAEGGGWIVETRLLQLHILFHLILLATTDSFMNQFIFFSFLIGTMDFLRMLLGCTDQSPKLPKQRARSLSKPFTLQQFKPQKASSNKKIDQPICQQQTNGNQSTDKTDFSAGLDLSRCKLLMWLRERLVVQCQKLSLGFLVGIINNHKQEEDFLEEDAFKIHLGQSHEIPSLSALRKSSLDSLLMFLDELPPIKTIQSILKCSQRLVIVVQHASLLKDFLALYEETLLEIYGDKTLEICLDKLTYEILLYKNRAVLIFQPAEKAEGHIKKLLSDKFKQLQEMEMVLGMITLQEFQRLKLLPADNLSSQINQIRKGVEDEMKEQRRLQQLEDIKEIFSDHSDEDYIEVEPLRKKSSVEAEYEAEYFCQRVSQKQTRDSNNSKYIQNSDLFYFIKEHDQDQQESDSEHSDCSVSPSVNEKSIMRIHRSNSCGRVVEMKVQQLDDEFFTKY